MLKERFTQYIQDQLKNNQGLQSIKMYKEEKEYAQKHHLLPEGITIEEINPISRFDDAYLERADKATDDVLAKETKDFLKQPISYFNTHKNEFLYVESKWFEYVHAEAVSFEVDDVFGTYDVMVGLKFPKKFAATIKEQLRKQLETDETPFDLMFNNEDGLWDLNFALNHVADFKEDMTVGEAYSLIYTFLFTLAEAVEEKA